MKQVTPRRQVRFRATHYIQIGERLIPVWFCDPLLYTLEDWITGEIPDWEVADDGTLTFQGQEVPQARLIPMPRR
jgi:hypothetical protein